MKQQTSINDLVILEIDDFLSEVEVNVLLTSKIDSFSKAISHYPSYYRDNDRLVEDNLELSNALFHKLKDIELLKGEVIAINERFRFCRYQNKQSFSKHQDGIYYTDKLQSKYTFLLYLNDTSEFTGGNTLFYTNKTDKKAQKIIVPKKGKLVIFDHRIWHKGDIVSGGNKYILRSDVMVNKDFVQTQHDGYIWSLLKLNNNTFLSCGRDKYIKLWNTELTLLNSFKIHASSVLSMIKFNDAEFISSSRDFSIKKWNLSGQVIASIQLNEMILKLVKTKTNTLLAVGTSGYLFILNSSLKVIDKIKIHNNWIWDVLSLDDSNVITCSEDKTINITNLKTKATNCLYKNNMPLFSIVLQNKNTLHVGAKNGTLISIALNLKTITKLKVHNDIIRSLLYYKHFIITCGEDNKIMSTNTTTNSITELYNSSNFIQDIIIINHTIYSAGFNGKIIKRSISLN